jgi:hypothetical protein
LRGQRIVSFEKKKRKTNRMSVSDFLSDGQQSIDVYNLTVNGTATGNFPSSSIIGLTSYIVDHNPALGTYTTIQSAINAAALVVTANPGLNVDVLIHNGVYVENLSLFGGVNLMAANQTPAQYQSEIFQYGALPGPFVTIQGQVTDTLVPMNFSFVSCSGLNFTDNGISPTMNLANVQLALNNCEVQSSPLLGGTGLVVNLTNIAFLQLQNSSIYSNIFSSPTSYALQLADNSYAYVMFSIVAGANGINMATPGSPFLYMEYSVLSTGLTNGGITMSNAGAYVESTYNSIFTNGLSWNFLAAGTVFSVFDQVASADPSGYVAAGAAGTLQLCSLSYLTNYGSNSTVSPTLSTQYLPVSQLSVATPTAASATTGAATLPANPVSFLPITVNGTAFKIALYNI